MVFQAPVAELLLLLFELKELNQTPSSTEKAWLRATIICRAKWVE
jgi:hypothetical protein